MIITKDKSIQLIKKIFIGKINIKYLSDGILVANNTKNRQKIILAELLKCKEQYVKVSFSGCVLSGSKKILLYFVKSDRTRSAATEINSNSLIPIRGDSDKSNHYLLYIDIPAETKVKIENIQIISSDFFELVDYQEFKGDILVITPLYPSEVSPYSATFVHSRIKEYEKFGIKADVALVKTYEAHLYNYIYDGKKINRVSYDELRNIIKKRHYKKILVHFLDCEIGNSLLGCDLDDTDILLYCHGVEDLWNKEVYGQYFQRSKVFSESEISEKLRRLEILRKFNSLPNTIWVFNTKWNLENTKAATGLSFSNYIIIPCFINENLFPFSERNDNLRTEILILKKMDNVRQYAVDIAVQIIQKLSKKPYFKKLNITVAGAGNFQNILTHPLINYENVHIHNHFYHNNEMIDVFRKHGLLLAPSRFDTQGVTACEAAMSGMVVIGSKGTGLSELLPENLGTFFNNDNIDEAIKIFDDIYNNPERLPILSRKFHEAIVKTAGEETVKKEIELLKSDPKKCNRLLMSNDDPEKYENPILSIIIPTYNAALYISNAVKSLVNQKNLEKLEIIIVNDGSTDDTANVIQTLIDSSSEFVRNHIRIINKENGGHGSTINAGLQLAKGKYFRILDSDDRMDSQSLEKHINFLSTTDADIVFTNTILDWSITSNPTEDCKYDFMIPHKLYDFDDLCEEYYGFPGYGPVLSTSSVKTEKLKKVGCQLTEKCYYVDIEYNYYMTEASDTAVLDPVFLYYYYLGRSGQSLSQSSYKKNFSQYLIVLENVIKLLEKNKLSEKKYEHFLRVQLHETISHAYRIALDYFNSYEKYLDVERVLSKYPKYYNDKNLTPKHASRLRKYGVFYFVTRKIYKKTKDIYNAVKKIIRM